MTNKFKKIAYLLTLCLVLSQCSKSKSSGSGGNDTPGACPNPKDYFYQNVVDTELTEPLQPQFKELYGDFTPPCMDVFNDSDAGLDDQTSIEKLVPQATYEAAIPGVFNRGCIDASSDPWPSGDPKWADFQDFYSYENFIAAVKTLNGSSVLEHDFLAPGSGESKQTKLTELAVLFSTIGMETKPDESFLNASAGSINISDPSMRMEFCQKIPLRAESGNPDKPHSGLFKADVNTIKDINVFASQINLANGSKSGYTGTLEDNIDKQETDGYIAWLYTFLYFIEHKRYSGAAYGLGSARTILNLTADFGVCDLRPPHDTTVADMKARYIAYAYLQAVDQPDYQNTFLNTAIPIGNVNSVRFMSALIKGFKAYAKVFGMDPKAYQDLGFAYLNPQTIVNFNSGFCG